MRKVRTFCVDFDDLCDNVAERTARILGELKAICPKFKATLFTIPKRTSAKWINYYRELGYVQLAPHGWAHTRGECLGWSDDEAKGKMLLARDMGIDAPVFRAPAWLLDGDTYTACGALGYTVATHMEYRIPNSNVKEYVYNDHAVKGVIRIHGHLTNCAVDNFIEDMLDKGQLDFPANSEFIHPQDIATVRKDEITNT